MGRSILRFHRICAVNSTLYCIVLKYSAIFVWSAGADWIKSGIYYLKSLKMKSVFYLTINLSIALSITPQVGQTQETITAGPALEAAILHLDSLFWQAYNVCDVDKMSDFLTEDVEFYHDKNGLATTRGRLMESIKKGLCGNENFRLRREAVAGTIAVFPLEGYGAILTGEHVFYVLEKGKPERLDGLARFTHVWLYKDKAWKMARILSYDHGPASRRFPK